MAHLQQTSVFQELPCCTAHVVDVAHQLVPCDRLGSCKLLKPGAVRHVRRIRGDDIHCLKADLALLQLAEVGEDRLEPVLKMVFLNGHLQQLDCFLLYIHGVDKVRLYVLAEYQRDYSAAGAQIANHAVGLYVRVVRQQESVRAEAVILGNVHRKRSQGEGFSLHIIAFLSCDLSDDYLPVGVNDVLAFCGVHKH